MTDAIKSTYKRTTCKYLINSMIACNFVSSYLFTCSRKFLF